MNKTLIAAEELCGLIRTMAATRIHHPSYGLDILRFPPMSLIFPNKSIDPVKYVTEKVTVPILLAAKDFRVNGYRRSEDFLTFDLSQFALVTDEAAPYVNRPS